MAETVNSFPYCSVYCTSRRWIVLAILAFDIDLKFVFRKAARASLDMVVLNKAADEVTADDFDAVIIPGGYAPDRMRRHPPMLDLVRGLFERGGVVAFICHAGWVPISAGILKGKRVTSFSAIKVLSSSALACSSSGAMSASSAA